MYNGLTYTELACFQAALPEVGEKEGGEVIQSPAEESLTVLLFVLVIISYLL